jgi:hypothetical protein
MKRSIDLCIHDIRIRNKKKETNVSVPIGIFFGYLLWLPAGTSTPAAIMLELTLVFYIQYSPFFRAHNCEMYCNRETGPVC